MSTEVELEREKVFNYLDGLRESGVTNMFGATPYIQQVFGFPKKKSMDLLGEWMRTFSDRHPKG